MLLSLALLVACGAVYLLRYDVHNVSPQTVITLMIDQRRIAEHNLRL